MSRHVAESLQVSGGWWWMSEMSLLVSAGAPLTHSFSLLHIFQHQRAMSCVSWVCSPLLFPLLNNGNILYKCGPPGTATGALGSVIKWMLFLTGGWCIADLSFSRLCHPAPWWGCGWELPLQPSLSQRAAHRLCIPAAQAFSLLGSPARHTVCPQLVQAAGEVGKEESQLPC